jgi:hypothetical protein
MQLLGIEVYAGRASILYWKKIKFRLHIYFVLLAYIRIEDTDVNDFRASLCSAYRSIQFRVWSQNFHCVIEHSISISTEIAELLPCPGPTRVKICIVWGVGREMSETAWKSEFAYLFASNPPLTYEFSDSLPFCPV